MNASLPPKPDQSSTARPSVERIRDAALKCFAEHGTAVTSLRDIADTAGVSIGLVQHHFGTKDRLIDAVDKHVLTVLGASLAGASTPSPDPVGEFGHRVTSLIAEQTEVIDYIVRALLEETPMGNLIFDALVAMGEARWSQHNEGGLTAPGLDRTWAALNPLLLVLGAMTLRPSPGPPSTGALHHCRPTIALGNQRQRLDPARPTPFATTNQSRLLNLGRCGAPKQRRKANGCSTLLAVNTAVNVVDC